MYRAKAVRLLRSEAVRRAFRLDAEDPKLRDRYGRTKHGQSLLLARRLVEAGVRFVTVYDHQPNGQLANWDAHADVFPRLKDDLLPPADRAFAALIEDLTDRGLLDSTLVIAMGEFGRTPKINGQAGRDHWPYCYSAVLAGGGVRGGTVYGASDKLGPTPISTASRRPTSPRPSSGGSASTPRPRSATSPVGPIGWRKASRSGHCSRADSRSFGCDSGKPCAMGADAVRFREAGDRWHFRFI